MTEHPQMMADMLLNPAGHAVAKIRAGVGYIRDTSNGEPPPDNLLPILIFPGFMSSGLKVEKSTVSKSWEGRRVWLNIASAGFEMLHSSGALVTEEEKRKRGEEFSETKVEEYNKELECKSKWLKHMVLSEDMRNDPKGVKVRPLEGLSAVDYLVPGYVVSNHISWVFSPVIKVLQEAGYSDDSLDAAPYDWRVPPCVLESRDGFFTKTMHKVEKMYRANDEKPVVLLCHSMGCKAGHYFLNFCLDNRGQEWLDKYIHSYMPIGAPHLGAPKAIRGIIDGDKMGLEAFMSDEEGLILARAFGSVPWLFPRALPASSTQPPVVVMRREGTLKVSVTPFECATIFRDRKRKDWPKALRLSVTFGDFTLHTNYKEPEGDTAFIGFPEIFSFPAPPELPGKEDLLEVSLEERGISIAKRERLEGPFDTWVIQPLNRAADFVKCSVNIFFPCLFVKEVVFRGADVALTGADTIASTLGSASKVATSGNTDLSNAFARQNPTQFMVKMMHVKDRRRQILGKIRFNNARSVAVSVRVKWEPPSIDDPHCDESCSPVAAPAEPTMVPDGVLAIKGKKNIEHRKVDGNLLLQCEGLNHCINVTRECFDNDPLGPRTRSAEEAPPVKRVKAVYGINLPTEAGAVYRRCSFIEKEGRVQMKHMPDTDAKLTKEGFKIEKGILLETVAAPQLVESRTKKEVVRTSGDGTVPYWSLQQSRAWETSCDVEIHELDRAEHREILKDDRFHKILLDHVRQKKGGDV